MRLALALVSLLLLAPALAADAPIIATTSPPTVGDTCPADFPTVFVVRSTGAEFYCAETSPGVWQWQQRAAGGGSGDMLKSSYDASGVDGVVDAAEALEAADMQSGSGALRDGTAQSVPCWDVGDGATSTPDGVCDVFLRPGLGVVNRAGVPIFAGRVPLVSLTLDYHSTDTGCDRVGGNCDGVFDADDWTNDDSAWAIREAAVYGVPVGIAAQKLHYCDGASPCPEGCVSGDIDGDAANECYFGLQEEGFDYAVAHGSRPGLHGSSHCGWGPASVDWSPSFGAAAGQGKYIGAGTVSVTEGSATLTGSGTDFDARCGGAPNERFSPRGAWVGVDFDIDGTVDWESHVASVESDTSLTLREAVPNLDGDGSAGETFSGLSVYIYTAGPMIRHEFASACEAFKAWDSTGLFRCDWGTPPGQSLLHDFYDPMVASFGVQKWDGALKSTPSAVNTGLVEGAQFFRVAVSCDSAAGAYSTILDRAVEAGVPGMILFGHTPTATCGAEPDRWSRAAWTEALTWCRDAMREGRAICADPSTIAQLHRLWGPPNAQRNIIVNPDMKISTAIDDRGDPSTYHAGAWPWFEADADFDLDDTGDVEHDATDDETVIRYRGANQMQIRQAMRLEGGRYYALYARLEPHGFVDDGAVRGAAPCLYIGHTGASYAWNRWLSPTWFVSPEIDPDDGRLDKNYAGTDQCARLVGDDMKDFDGDGTFDDAIVREREVFGSFFVPPQLDGVTVQLEIRIEGGDVQGDGTDNDGDGSSDETDYVILRDLALAPQQSTGHQGALNKFSAVPTILPSHLGHDRTDRAAYQLEWHPPAGTVSDTPAADALRLVTPSTTDVDRTPVAVDGSGRIYSDAGVCVGIPGNANDAKVKGDFLCLARDATGIFEDIDRDGSKDSGEDYIGEAREIVYPVNFVYQNLAAGLSPASAYMFQSGLAGLQGWTADRDGELVRLACYMSQTTAGDTASAEVRNLSASNPDLSVSWSAGTATYASKVDADCTTNCSYTAGNRIVVALTTGAAWSSTTADLGCEIWVRTSAP